MKLLPAKRCAAFACACDGCRENINKAFSGSLELMRKQLRPFIDAMSSLFQIPQRIKAQDEEFKKMLREIGAMK